MKGDIEWGPLQRHVYLHAFGWTPDGYTPRHAHPYRQESELAGRGRHRAERGTGDMGLHYRDLLQPIFRLVRS